MNTGVKTNKLQNIAIGSIFFAAATLLSKTASVAGQVVLGWYLSAEDFGVYAIAMSIASWMTVLRNGGTDQVLIQRGAEYNYLSSKILSFSLAFNVLATGLLLLSSIGASAAYDEPRIIPIMVVIGLAYLLTSPAVILKSKLAIDARYRLLSAITAFANIGRHLSAMLLAFLGAGVMSLALPIALEPLLIGASVYLVFKQFPRPQLASRSFYIEMFYKTRWVMLSNLGVALSLTGVYFVASLFVPKSDVGLLFFSMQLVTAVSVIVTNSINGIVFPHLSNSVTHTQYNDFLLKGISVCLLLGTFLSALLFFISASAVSYLWNGKWDDSISLIKLLSLTMPFSLLNALLFSILSSKGMWRSRLIVIMSTVSIDIFVIAAGCLFSGIYAGVLYLTIGKALGSIAALFITLRILDIRWNQFSSTAIDLLFPIGILAWVTLISSENSVFILSASLSFAAFRLFRTLVHRPQFAE